jgi:hypothetical protein
VVLVGGVQLVYNCFEMANKMITLTRIEKETQAMQK